LVNIGFRFTLDESLPIEEQLSSITDYIIESKRRIKRGDIIDTNKHERYRNMGVFIWDGTKAVQLSIDFDDYGSVPKEFIVTETDFSPWYWSRLVDHNYYYWPCVDYRQQVFDSLVFDSEFTEKEMWHGKYRFRDEIINVILDLDDGENPKDRVMQLPFECDCVDRITLIEANLNTHIV